MLSSLRTFGQVLKKSYVDKFSKVLNLHHGLQSDACQETLSTEVKSYWLARPTGDHEDLDDAILRLFVSFFVCSFVFPFVRNIFKK